MAYFDETVMIRNALRILKNEPSYIAPAGRHMDGEMWYTVSSHEDPVIRKTRETHNLCCQNISRSNLIKAYNLVKGTKECDVIRQRIMTFLLGGHGDNNNS